MEKYLEMESRRGVGGEVSGVGQGVFSGDGDTDIGGDSVSKDTCSSTLSL